MRQPAEPPARHRPRFGEAVDHDQPVVGLGHVEERGRARPVVGEPDIDLVGDDGEAAPAARRQQVALLVRLHHPARRVAGRVDEHADGAVVANIQHAVEIEAPAAVGIGRERHHAGLAAHDVDRLDAVGPHRPDHDHVVAGIDQRLRGQHDGVHAGARDGQPVGADLTVVQP